VTQHSPSTTPSERPVVGVDGCRAGWIAVARSAGGLTYRLHDTLNDLVTVWRAAEHIFVDIPIGLPSAAQPSRACDTEARRRLGPGRASSVFSPPCRAAVLASRPPDASGLGRAREINQRELGRSLSAQAWGICPKIAEADSLLWAHPSLRQQVKEVHPELSFWALNRGQPMQFAKKRPEGAAERIALLMEFEPGTQGLIDRVLTENRRSAVGRDDVVDAIAAMLTALPGTWSAAAVPDETHVDALGLPTCMWIPARRDVPLKP